ncbi:MAG: hypothetical protein JW882_15760 [Deltaproteobacteria bacterium]|nr:hypothetical protein [Deltaproteobacteria bacterium]
MVLLPFVKVSVGGLAGSPPFEKEVGRDLIMERRSLPACGPPARNARAGSRKQTGHGR